jgi:hypothetical protein
MKTYNHTADAHLAPWLKARFGLTVEYADFGYYQAHMGDYDLDIASALGRSILDAATNYADSHDDKLSDELAKVLQ